MNKGLVFLVLLVFATPICGCVQNVPQTYLKATQNSNLQVVETKIPIKNIAFFSDGIGIMYYKRGRVYLAFINTNNSSAFEQAEVPAKLYFSGNILKKVVVHGRVYSVYRVVQRKIVNGTIEWVNVSH